MGGDYSQQVWPQDVDTPDGARAFGMLLPSLLHDFCFFADQSGLPAIISVEDLHVQVTQLRPRLTYRKL